MQMRAGVAIDLGTVNTLVWVTGRGVVVDEPSAIALDRAHGTVAEVGQGAADLEDREPQDIEVLRPLRDGVISDVDAATAMLRAFVRKARLHRLVLRPDAVVCVPSGATWVERRAVAVALQSYRPRFRVKLIEEPVAAAAGTGLDLSSKAAAFIVDIGGGTTEVAAVTGARLVRARSLRAAGNAMDTAIMDAARSELGLILGRDAARQLKMTLGLTGGADGSAEAVGLDAATRAARIETVRGEFVAAALESTVTAIADSLQELLSDIPPGLAQDLVRGKIWLAGGGALLPGLASRIESSAGVATLVADDPLRCTIRGAAALLEARRLGPPASA